MEDIKLEKATQSQIEETLLDKFGEVLASKASTEDLILLFDFFSMTEDDKIKLIFKILNPQETFISYMDEERVKKLIKSY